MDAQGPGTNIITTVATSTDLLDLINPQLSSTNNFSVVVNEVNVAPVLTVPGNQTINELAAFSANATATDADLPANTLTFALVSAPAGMAISPATGLITWTPTEAQGPSTNVVTVSVTDTNPAAVNAKSLSSSRSFTVVVNEVNRVPVLPIVSPQTVNELAQLTVFNAASAANIHATLSYTLLNPPNGASVDANGVITWTPDETQGPGTNIITTVATSTDLLDLINPQLSATNSFTVVVNEVNVAPVLTVPGNQTINELTLLSVSATATDADVPANALTFALVSAPAGMAIDGGSGLITWTPADSQVGTTNVTVRVTDNGSPSLSDTGTFSVTVVSRPRLSIASTTSSTLTLSWNSIAGVRYRVQFRPDVKAGDWFDLAGDVTATGPTASKTDIGTGPHRFYRVQVLP